MTKQEVIKQEPVEFTVMDHASGTTTVLYDYFLPVEFDDHMTWYTVANSLSGTFIICINFFP